MEYMEKIDLIYDLMTYHMTNCIFCSRCGCPFGTPDPASCASGFIDELYCQCAAPLPSTYCCQTSEPNFLPWAGRCWGQTSAAACNAVDAGRCVWDSNNCHPGILSGDLFALFF